jgi:hypothetical protein
VAASTKPDGQTNCPPAVVKLSSQAVGEVQRRVPVLTSYAKI